MERTLKLIFAGAFIFLAFASCNKKEETINNPATEYDDSYYASQATISSSDANFTANGNGGDVYFKTEGGQVLVNVNCGCDWTINNNASDIFATSLTSSTLTIKADHNTVEEDLTGTITIMTVSQRISFSTITVTQTAYGAPEINVETSEWNAPAKGALTAEISVEATADWIAESAASWLTVVKTGSGISLNATENGNTEKRSTKVTITCTDGIRTEYEYVTVNQDAAAYVILEMKKVVFSAESGLASVTVESNFDWDYIYDTLNGWFTVSNDSDGLTVTVMTNTGDVRNGIVSITAGDGMENVAEGQLVVTQGGINDLIFTYTITSANITTQLPLYRDVDCTVDWGDGSDPETVTSSRPSHTYAETGAYNIIVSGTVSQIYSNGIPTLPLTAVKQWGKTGLINMQYAFYNCTELVSLPEYTGEAFSDVTSFNYAFFGCTSLKEIPAELFETCTKAKDFQQTFRGCSTLRIVPAGLFENCINVTSFVGVFYECTSLEEIPAGLFENCSETTDFSYIFFECKSLRAIPAGVFSNCTKATNFYAAFYNCSSIGEISSGLFDNCVAATDFSWCFYNCTSLKKIPKEFFVKNTKATTFYATFYNCTSLEEVPSQLFGNCSEAKTLEYCFYYCTSLNTIAADAFNCPKVTNMSNLFCTCTSLTEIPKGLFDNCPEVTSFQATFDSASSLTTIPDGLFDKCLKVTTFRYVFYCCTSLIAIPDGLFANCPEATSFLFAFYDCTSLKTIPANMFANCPKVTIFNGLFYNCASLAEIPAGLFDGCPEATDFSYSFYSSSISSIPSGLFDKNTKVDTFSAAFFDCTNITGIPSGLFDKCVVATDFSYVFRGCTGITTIPENLFSNCPEATNFRAAFYNNGITEIPAKIFANNKKAENFTVTFSTCYGVGGESPYDEIEGMKVHLYERANYLGIYTTPTTYDSCFSYCTGLTDYSSIPSSWGGEASGGSIYNKVTSLSETSYAISKFVIEPVMLNP